MSPLSSANAARLRVLISVYTEVHGRINLLNSLDLPVRP